MYILCSCSQDSASQYFLTAKFNPERDAAEDIALAINEAKQSKKHILLDSAGKFLHSQGSGELEEGDHHDRDKVLVFLKKWAPVEISG